MPTSILPSLTTDQVDDLLYLSRLGETTDLQAAIDIFAKTLSTTPGTILTAAVDKDSGNGLLHMAAANGHTDTLNKLLALSASNHALSLNLQNASGNTPLHWAALNGHLPVVKLLIETGADAKIMNGAGKDAVYEAEANEKNEIAAWLLTGGEGLAGTNGSGPDQPALGVQGEVDVEEEFEEVTKDGQAEG